MVWENIEEDTKTSAKESLCLHKLKHYRPWFGEECLGFLDQMKRAEMQRVQGPSQSSVDNLINVRREASRHLIDPCQILITKHKITNLTAHMQHTTYSIQLQPCENTFLSDAPQHAIQHYFVPRIQVFPICPFDTGSLKLKMIMEHWWKLTDKKKNLIFVRKTYRIAIMST